MKKFIKKILMTFVISLFLCSCKNYDITYKLDSQNFNDILAYNSTLSLSDLSIHRKVGNITEVIEITEDMIVSGDLTDSVGQKELIIKYQDEVFVINVTVKYKVEFKVNNEVIDTQYVLSKDEIVIPEDPFIDGLNFIGWGINTESLSNNVSYNAYFTLSDKRIPKLLTVNATYGDTLENVSLPSNDYGRWVFVDDLTTSVGNAGENKFKVRFEPNNTQVAVENREVTVKVAKKKIEFSTIIENFTFDGKVKTPIYHLEKEVDNIKMTPLYTGDAVNVGEYFYILEVKDDNYEVDQYFGKLTISKAKVVVTVPSVEINFGDEVPSTFDYIVKDNEGNDLSKEMLSLLNFSIVRPTYLHAENYLLNTVYDNRNFSAIIYNGYLVVKKIELNVDKTPPSFVGGPNIVYGSKLNTVEFEDIDLRGTWRWENPNYKVLTDTSITAKAIFVPYEDKNYLVSEKEIVLNVEKKIVTINVPNQSYVYDGKSHSVSYSIVGLEGNDTVEVLGNRVETTAGDYDINLVIDGNDKRYTGSTTTKLFIDQASISDFSTVYYAVWNGTLKLSDINLIDGYSWVEDSTPINNIGEQSFLAKFTPEDTVNYKTEEQFIKINVAKANCEIKTNNHYVFEYNKEGYVLTNIVLPHDEQVPVYKYFRNGEEVDRIDIVGDYVVEISMEESVHYNKPEDISFTVKVNKYENRDSVISKFTAVYGDQLSKFSLPQSKLGTWSWNSDVVGNAGVREHVAIFTPNDIHNYAVREVVVTFDVAKKQVSSPTIYSTTYNGKQQVADVEDTYLYTVKTNNGGIDGGKYDVVLELIDSENYCWSSENNDKTKTLTFEVLKNTTNVWTKTPNITGWTYGDAENSPESDSTFGETVVEYKLKSAEDSEYTTEKPSKAGDYVARFRVEDCSSYNGLSDVIVEFRINYIEVQVPTILSKTYNSKTQTADIVSNDFYTVIKNDEVINADTYEVIIKLNNDSYKWIDSYELERKLSFTINKIVNIDEYVDTYKATYEDLISSYGLPHNANGTWSWVGEETVGNAGTLVRIAKFTPNDPANYEGREISVTFNIDRKVVQIPVISATTFNNDIQVANIPVSEKYSVITNAGGKNAGEYLVVIELNDVANYRWAGKDSEKQLELSFKIVKNETNNWNNVPTIGDWKYGETPNIPEVSSKYGDVVIEYKLASDNNDNYSKEVPTKAGTYMARFTVAGTDNYNELLDYYQFDIGFIEVSVPTITDTIYNGEYQTANIKTSDKYTILTDTLSYKNAGSYGVKVRLNNDSYKWTDSYVLDRTIMFNIAKVENKDIVNEKYNAIYLDKLSKFALPENVTGVWSWKTGGETLVGNFGERKHTAIFIPNDPDNYASREVVVLFNVEKKIVQQPTIEKATYTGENQVADISSTSEYLVVENNGGIAKGFYNVILALVDSENYRWGGKDNESEITLKFEIAQNANNKWKTVPNITGWTYGDDKNSPQSDSVYGDVLVEYKLKTASDESYSLDIPEDAGVYIARFKVIETDNYNGLEQEIEFKIKHYEVTAPIISNSIYTGEKQTANVASNEYYEVVENEEVIDAGSYDVKLTLKNKNFIWSDSDVVEKTLIFTIEKVINTDVVAENYTATYEDLLTSYALPENETGTWSWVGTTVGNAGTNNITAKFTPDDSKNYEDREVTVVFTVSKKVVALPNITPAVFNNTKQVADVEDSNLYTVLTNNGGVVKGEYDVVLALTDSDNYCWRKGDSSKETIVKFYILKNNENTWSVDPYIAGWTYYSGTQSTPVGKALYGEYKIEYKLKTENDDKYSLVMPSAAGEYVARYSVADDISYNAISQIVEFKVEHYVVGVPTISSSIYTGEKQTANIPTSDFYSVITNNEVIDADTYYVCVRLNYESYKWSDSYELDKVLPFVINKVINTDAVAESYTATYEDLLNSYELPENETGTWSWVGSTVGNAGTNNITAKFTPIDSKNYEDREVTVVFTVSKKVVIKPETIVTTYNGGSQTTTIENTNLYTVISQATGTDAGEYSAILSLVDKDNYCWGAKDDSQTTTVTLNILKNTTNVWNTKPTITGCTYGESLSITNGSAKFGDNMMQIMYKVKDADDSTYTLIEPTKAGEYYARFIIADNNNFNGVSEVVYFKIDYLEIQIPTINSVTYTGKSQKADVVTNKYYDIVKNNAVIDAGTYDIILKINDDSCKWPDSFVMERTLKFTINKATDNDWTTKPSITSFDYTPTALDKNKGVAVSKYGNVKITYSVKDANSYSETFPTLVGSYDAKFEVVETGSYNGINAVVVSFNINKATPVLSSLDLANIVYENNTEGNKTIVDEGIKASVPGKFEYTLPKLVTTSTSAYSKVIFTVKFTPDDTSNYLVTSGTASINMYSVCYIDNTYYGSIENALANAVSGNKVIVIPNTTGNVTIASDTTIASGVTLILPYVVDGVSKYNESGVAELYYDNTNKLEEFNFLVLTNQVVIKSNVTLTNNGTLLISGERSAGAGGHGSAGHTARNFAELVLSENAKIVSNGTIRLYGYIDESSDNNKNSSIEIKSGSLYMPFIISDHRGGTYMSTAYTNLGKERVTPFNQYEFRNIIPKLIFHSAAKFMIDANMAAQNEIHHSEVKFMGGDETYFIQLAAGGRIEAKYIPNRTTVDNNNRWAEGVNEINFFGGATTNTLDMVVLGQEVSTQYVDFPLTWRQRVVLNSGVYAMNNSFKMMPGHVFTVNSGATLTANKINIYESYTDQISIHLKYKSGLNPAKFILRGNLNVTGSIGGKIYSDTANAQFVASNISCTTYESKPKKVLFFSTYTSDPISNESTVLYYTTDVNGFLTSGGVTASKNTTYKVVNGVWTKV